VVDVRIAFLHHRIRARRATDVHVQLALNIEPRVSRSAHDDVGTDPLVARHVAAGKGELLVAGTVARAVDRGLVRADQQVERIRNAIAIGVTRWRHFAVGERGDRRGAEQRLQLGAVTGSQRQHAVAELELRVTGEWVDLDRPSIHIEQEQSSRLVHERGGPRRARFGGQLDLHLPIEVREDPLVGYAHTALRRGDLGLGRAGFHLALCRRGGSSCAGAQVAGAGRLPGSGAGVLSRRRATREGQHSGEGGQAYEIPGTAADRGHHMWM